MFKLNIFLLGAVLIIASYNTVKSQEEEDYDDYPMENGGRKTNDPCLKWSPGDRDLNLLDAYTRNRFEESQQQHLRNVAQVQGPTTHHVAYHIEERMNMTIETFQALPDGVPFMFSFETTFRSAAQYTQPWYLFVINSVYFDQEISVIMNPIYQNVEISIEELNGGLQKFYFHEQSLFDHHWHKLMFALNEESVRLWVDCKESIIEKPKERLNRGQISNNGHLSMAQDVKTGRTVALELQGMSISCDVEKPSRTTCEELLKYDILPEEPEIRMIGNTINGSNTIFENDNGQCSIRCSPGPPGKNGPQGPPGLPGPPGLNAFPYNPSGQKGEKGERGNDGYGFPGPQGPPGMPGSSFNIPLTRVFNGTKGDKGERGLEGAKGERGFTGPSGPPGQPGAIHYEGMSHSEGLELYRPGSPGLPGPPGHPGDRGEKGERGDTGFTGSTGLPGLNGIPGFKGDKGHKGQPGAEGKPGPMGPRGEIGFPGPEGQRGDRGPEGTCVCPQRPEYLITGPRGPQGSPGLPGNDGVAGPPGQPGSRGPPGIPGPPSPPPSELNIDDKRIKEIVLEIIKDYFAEMSSQLIGPPGPPGRTRIGKPGPPGLPGLVGETGSRGLQGERGYPGMPGIPGPRGDIGLPGKNGVNGEKGEKGDTGIGTQGTPGPRGYPGVPGRDGFPGSTGERGETGRAGDEGPRGPPGQPGECPDCSAYSAYSAYPYMYQGNSKGPSYNE